MTPPTAPAFKEYTDFKDWEAEYEEREHAKISEFDRSLIRPSEKMRRSA